MACVVLKPGEAMTEKSLRIMPPPARCHAVPCHVDFVDSPGERRRKS